MHLLGRGNYLTESVDIVTLPGYTEAASRAVFQIFDQHASTWDVLVLPNLPADTPLVNSLHEVAAEHGYSVYADNQARIWRPLPDSWEAFYRSLKKSMKDNVNNFVNRLHREGRKERLLVARSPGELDEALDVFFDLHRKRSLSSVGRHHDDRFSSVERRAFLRDVALQLVERGWLWPCLLEVDGRPVAAQLCFVYGNQICMYYSGFDPAWSRYGVMTVLTRRCIERAIRHGYQALDLLVGMDHDKLRWGGQPRPVVNMAFANRQLRSRVVFNLYRINRAVGDHLA
jgi:CelD/BcsL family acetyltransferase involved in cellulose biosynthesis